MRSDDSLDQDGSGGNEEKNPTEAPRSVQAHFLPKPCHQECAHEFAAHGSLSTLQGSAGVSSSRKPSPDKASPPRSFRSSVYLLHCPFSHLILLYGLAVLRSIPGDGFICLVVLLPPAVRLENLWLDGLIAGTAHYEIEVVMCGIMAK